MKAAFLCCILLLAGSVSSSPVEASKITLPDLPDWIGDLIGQLPDTAPEWIVDLFDRLPDSIQDIINSLPEIAATIPELIPAIIDGILEAITQLPALLEQVPGFVEQVINSIPQYIPDVLEAIPEIIAAIPGVYEMIQEYLESLGLPDWFPTLPNLEAPTWWPEELPTLPEYNFAVEGTRTTIEENPGVVQIEVGTGPVWIQGCTGTVLTSMHILSVARCFTGGTYESRFRRVRAGSSSRLNEGIIVPVQSALVHPTFGEDSVDADIAIVRLANNLVFGATIQQAAIVSGGFELPTGLSVKHVGYGTTAQGKPYADPNLYEIDLSVIDQDVCTASWSRISLVSITDNTLCVGRSETGGRNGDIRDMGAPVIYENVVVGVVSVGVPVGNQVFPVVTTKVSAYTDWIVANAN